MRSIWDRQCHSMKGSAAKQIGSVPYLNAAPLTWGMEAEIVLEPPSQLARRLHGGELSAALISITEVLFNPDYLVLDGFGIVSDGPVYSVMLAHRVPLEEIRVVDLDPASCTSVNLLKVLLAERGLSPEFRPLASYPKALNSEAVLLIGDPAIEFRRRMPLEDPHAARRGDSYQIWDLGEAWRERTGLPFVYAAWAIRRDADWTATSQRLERAYREGMASLDRVIEGDRRFDVTLRRAYLGGCIRYAVGDRERAGVERFGEWMTRYLSRRVFPVEWKQATSHSAS